MSVRNMCTLGLALFLGIAAAHAKKESRSVALVPLTPEQAALVQKAVEREKATVKLIQKSTPVVQTYIQNMRPDPKLQTVPVSDQYIIARVDFGKGCEGTKTSAARHRAGSGVISGKLCPHMSDDDAQGRLGSSGAAPFCKPRSHQRCFRPGFRLSGTCSLERL